MPTSETSRIGNGLVSRIRPTDPRAGVRLKSDTGEAAAGDGSEVPFRVVSRLCHVGSPVQVSD